MDDGVRCREILEGRECDQLKKYALRSAERRNALGSTFREREEPTKLEYRTEYHRDRDRILWSSAFRRLQHKTQIFPHYVEDHYRRRLTHSLEVAQIATTMCRALGLNEIAAEAIALGHDLGHTPFGHAGEQALNENLAAQLPSDNGDDDRENQENRLDRMCATPVLLYGFDHCAQGVEQLSRISMEYGKENPGLNLSFDVRDGILKHIFGKTPQEARDEKRLFSSLTNIVRLSKFAEFKNNCGSLEAQCVWLADKVGYLLGDLEDAFRAKIFTGEFITELGLVRYFRRKYRERRRGQDENSHISSHDDFRKLRREALVILILDCVEASRKRIESAKVASVEDVLDWKERLIDVGDEIRTEWDGYYKNTVEKELFRHDSVKTCGFKAKKIVKDIFLAYNGEPDLLPRKFRGETHTVYEDLLDEEKRDLMAVRNYIAGMTDSYATEQHKRLFMSSERASPL